MFKQIIMLVTNTEFAQQIDTELHNRNKGYTKCPLKAYNELNN